MLVEQLPNLDLALVDLRDMNILAISDVSTYLTVPDAAHLSLQITIPGGDTVNVDFVPLSVNIYKCVDLGITCSDTSCTPLPDGIYSVIYSVLPMDNSTTVPSVIQKKFVKIDQLKCKFEHVFSKLDLLCDCPNPEQLKYKNELRRIRLFIDGCVCECNRGNYVLSYKLYEKADFLIKNMTCTYGNVNFKGNCKC